MATPRTLEIPVTLKPTLSDEYSTFIQVRHNIEVAHRLYLLQGKCENIHGHSMWVELNLYAPINDAGYAGGLAFGDVKAAFRQYLDGTYDHHLLLNEEDPWAGRFYVHDPQKSDPVDGKQLPGLMAMPGDPSTENLSRWIAEWAKDVWGLPVSVLVHETGVNAAGYHLL